MAKLLMFTPQEKKMELRLYNSQVMEVIIRHGLSYQPNEMHGSDRNQIIFKYFNQYYIFCHNKLLQRTL